jgi:hypothetical protein
VTPTILKEIFIEIILERESASDLTSVWAVVMSGGLRLGTIAWFSPWRRYTFQAAGGSIFGCAYLRVIADFVEHETAARWKKMNDPKD